MSWHPAADPRPGDAFACDAIETVIAPRSRDLGGFEVRRALPSAERRMVGPFIFFDQMGPALPLDADHDERAIYTVSGEIDIAGDVFGPGRLLVFRPGDRMAIRARTAARVMMLGGEPMEGPRHIWWNFVSSRRERIDQAKADWKSGRFDTVPGDEAEFISLPEQAGETPVVRYP